MKDQVRILYIDDNPLDRALVRDSLEREHGGFILTEAKSRIEFEKLIHSETFDVILTDFNILGFEGLQVLKTVKSISSDIPVIIVTGTGSEEVAVEAMKLGAGDYVIKTLSHLSRLPLAILSVLETRHLENKRKQAEEIIIRERKMLRTLIDNLPDMIYVKDNECRKVIANLSDVKNIGFIKEEEVLGKTDLELFPGEKGQRGYETDKEVINTGKPIYDSEEDFINSQGVKGWLLTTKVPLVDKKGKITGLVGIGHDITKSKLIEDELRMAKDKAEESNRLKTAFLHNISHEIRTPMNAIFGFSSMLDEPGIDKDTRTSFIEIITNSSNQLLSIVNNIVDISNIDANLEKIVKSEINLEMILNSVSTTFTPKAGEKKIELLCEKGRHYPGRLILSDKIKITQILSHLVNNAIKYTNKGSVKVWGTEKEDFVEFRVSDMGPGIPPEYNNLIFDRFFQIQTDMSTLNEGTGLGLSIAKAYVEMLGGKIWFDSVLGKGTTFHFIIPVDILIPKTKIAVESKQIDKNVRSGKKTILIAEDITSNYRLLQEYLSDLDVNILRAKNGDEAVAQCLSGEKIDLVLMDIKMPGMDGYTAAKIILESKPEIPIVVQTAYSDDFEKAMECGCRGFIPKPFDQNQLLEAIKDYI